MSTSKHSIDQLFESLSSDSDSSFQRLAAKPEQRTSLRTASWLSIACVAIAFLCFLPRISALFSVSEAHASSQPKVASPYITKPIEDIRPGDRVLAHNPEVTDEQRTASVEIVPRDWRLLELLLTGEDGHQVNVRLLRPLEWLERHQAEVGSEVRLGLEEIGVEGHAGVLHISPCPPIKPGNGQVVTGAFQHISDDLVKLCVSGEKEPIVCTSGHPFWSEDRKIFVGAEDLKVGELLLAANGKVLKVEGLDYEPTAAPVFNFEVNVEHVYFVGEKGILVHNNTPCVSKRKKAIRSQVRVEPQLAFGKILQQGKIHVSDLRSIIPKGADNKGFTPSQRISHGEKFQFQTIDGKKVEVKWHSPDRGAAIDHPGSNSGSMWTAQIKIGNKFLGADGQLHNNVDNITHIPVEF